MEHMFARNICFKMGEKMNPLYKVISKITKENYRPELVRIQNEPGSGKSHNVAQVIADDLNNSNSHNIWLYLTTDKQNRDSEYKAIKKLAIGHSDEMLLLKSNKDYIVEFFQELIKEHGIKNDLNSEEQCIIDNFLKKINREKCPQTYIIFKKIIEQIFRLKRFSDLKNNFADSEIEDEDQKELIKNIHQLNYSTENDFKRQLSQIRKQRQRDQKDTQFTLEEKKEIFTGIFPWYEQIFPSINMTKYRCIVTTAHKFFFPVRNFLGEQKSFVELYKNEHVTLIMDEADQIKKVWLDQIINSVAPEKGDSFQCEDIFILFRRILQSLSEETNSISFDFISKKENQKILTAIRKRFKDVAKKYYLNCNVQLDPDLEIDNSHFIFNDGAQNIVFNSDHEKERLIIKYDKRQKINIITLAKKDKKGGVLLSKALRDMKSAITFFVIKTNQLAAQYHQFKIDKNDELKTPRYVIMDLQEEHLFILRTLIPPSTWEQNHLHEYLIQTFLERKTAKSKLNAKNLFTIDNSMFNRGFHYYRIISNPDREAMVHVYLFAQKNTPEKILAQAANNWRVLMVSATIDNESSLANFDFHWLESHVSCIRDLNSTENELLNEDNKKRVELYQKNVVTEVSQISIYTGKDTVEHVFKNWLKRYNPKISINEVKELLDDYPEDINVISSYDDEMVYYFDRDLKTLAAIISMIHLYQNDPTKQSFIIYRNAKTDSKMVTWFLNVLEKINLKNYDQCLVTIAAKDKRDSLPQIKRDWQKGDLRILLTTYATLERGVNLQYPVPDKYWKNKNKYYAIVQEKFVDWDNPKKDLDGIYLEKPTHIYTSNNSSFSINNNQVLHYIFEQDELYQDGFQSFGKKKVAIEHFLTGMPFVSLANLYPIICAALVKVEQALGRVSRVEIKNKQINVFVDNSLTPLLSSFNQGRRMNGLLRDLLKNVKENGHNEELENAKNQRELNQLSNKMKFVVENWANVLRKSDPEIQQEWLLFRELVLKYPIINSMQEIQNDKERDLLTFCYCNFNEKTNFYYYAATDDYKVLKYFNLKKVNLKQLQIKELNFKEYNQILQRIFAQNSWLKDEFLKRGYVTDLGQKENLLLSPGIFNNFYKAAISEKIVEFVCNHFQIDCHSMRELSEDEFEKMDGYFKTADNQILYYDVKNYNEEKATRYLTNEQFTRKELNKLKTMQGDSVVIINFYDWKNSHHKAKRLSKPIQTNAMYSYPFLFAQDGRLNRQVVEDIFNCVGRKENE